MAIKDDLEVMITEKDAINKKNDTTEDDKRRLLYIEGYLDGYWSVVKQQPDTLVKVATLSLSLLEQVKDYARKMDELISAAQTEVADIQNDMDD